MDHKTISSDKRQHRICMLNSLIELTWEWKKKCEKYIKIQKILGALQIFQSRRNTKNSHTRHERVWRGDGKNLHRICKNFRFHIFQPNDVYLTSSVVWCGQKPKNICSCCWNKLIQFHATEIFSLEFVKTFIKIYFSPPRLHQSSSDVWHVDDVFFEVWKCSIIKSYSV